MENTYWNGKGKHQALGDELRKLIPEEGAVKGGRGRNKALETYRKACNCYYDLYNNGLINRKAQFIAVFETGPMWRYEMGRGLGYPRFAEELYEIVEAKMDEIVLAAAIEQDLD